MNTNDYVDLDDDFEEADLGGRRRPDTRRPYAGLARKMAEDAGRFKRAQVDYRNDFKFTYEPARFEEWWLLASLGPLYEHQWIGDVLRRVQSGKEASVYQCLAGAAIHADFVAGKVYRPWSLRNMKNDSAYRQGRADLDDEGHTIIDDGMLHAIEKKTEYGRLLLHQSWIAYEYRTLQALHAAGADVPQPYVMANNTILMSFVGDAQRCAPTLNEVSLDRAECGPLFERVLRNIGVMLSRGRVHGDLSAFNILYWKGRITLIDFPQVVSPGANPAAFRIFQRDVRRICEYFARQGLDSDAEGLARTLWESQGLHIPEAPPDE